MILLGADLTACFGIRQFALSPFEPFEKLRPAHLKLFLSALLTISCVRVYFYPPPPLSASFSVASQVTWALFSAACCSPSSIHPRPQAFAPGAKSVQAVLTALSVPGVQGWPVVLSDFVPRPSTDPVPASPPFLVDEAAPPPSAQEQPRPPETEINPYGAPVFAAADGASSVAQSLPAQDAGESTAQMRGVDVGEQPSAVDADSPRHTPAAEIADEAATQDEHTSEPDVEDRGSEPEPAAHPTPQSTRGSRGEELAKAYLRGFITRRAIASGRMRGE